MKSRWFTPFLLMLSLTAILVTGCGSKVETTPEPAKQPAAEAPANSSKEATVADAPRSIKHAAGETEIKGTPKRVVVLEWTYAEDVLALGVQPVGAADMKGYSTNVNVKPALDTSTVDVGTRQEPNLETIASLKPDLIIGVSFRHKAIYEKLNGIAPTLLFEPYPPENGPNQYQEMEETFLTIADVLGKKEQGESVLKQMNESFAKAAEKLKAANKAGSDFLLVQAFTSKDVPTLRIFTDNSMASQILTKVGLKNAYKAKKFEVYGFASTGIEELPAYEKANFLYVVQEKDNIFENQLKNHPVWNGLGFVKEKRTYSLGGSTWLFGGPLSAQVFVNQVVGEMTK
ncbi:ABC transporter substrate-binding protein [Paenibacillus turpanensis]|uniref:ABC transporter substrate-binding protein n=1 Tax=Paenibacillus turpanensis TaxID=2689078 RepID=UPI001FB858C0|nr:iron-siderophore ABC transporter substrate-binding protein [Paenibacillus turpanensis]